MTIRWYFTVALFCVCPLPAFTQGDAANPAVPLAPLLNEQTVMVAHVDLSKIDVNAAVKMLGEVFDAKPAQLQAAKQKAKVLLDTVRGWDVQHVYAVYSLDDLAFNPMFIAAPVKDTTGDKTRTKLRDFVQSTLRFEKARYVGNFLVAGQKAIVERVAAMKPEAHPQLVKAFAAVAKYDAQAVFVLPNKTLRKALAEVLPRLPKQFGGIKTAPLLKAFHYAAVGVTLKGNITAKVVVQSSDNKGVKRLNQLYDAVVSLFQKEIPSEELRQIFQKLRPLLKPKQHKDQLVWAFDQQKVVPLLKPLIARAKLVNRASQSQNNLKHIALAMHVYLDQYKSFPPPANYDKNGKPLLSWRVHILPYIEQDNLYKQFRLNEPWDSPHNKKLIAKMPAVYRNPNAKTGPGLTTYLVPVSKETIFGKKKPRIQDIKDGTSNTILVVEVDDNEAVVWTKPADLPVIARKPLRGLGNNKRKQFDAVLADGSVHRLSRDIAPATLWGMFTRAGGEVINFP